MLIQWMSYATIIAALCACGALAVEHVAAIWGASRRAVWIVALGVATAAPLALAVRRAPTTTVDPAVNAGVTTTQALQLDAPRGTGGAPPSVSLIARAERGVRVVNEYSLIVWIGASAGLLIVVLKAVTTLRVLRRRWVEADLDGERVLVAGDVGPAVVGALRPQIVVPEWALALDGTARQLMLRHEREHILKRDPQVLLLATLASIVFPWNPALWLIVRRLRLTIEMDCDGRVLRAANHPREYGLLLLTVGARQRAAFQLAPSLAERRPLLERRIKAMTTSRPTHPKLVTTALIVVAASATIAATRTPRPNPLRPAQDVARSTAQAITAPEIIATPVARETERAPVAPREVPVAQQRQARSVEVSPLREVPVARRGGDLTLDEIRALIRQYHPSVFDGDPNIGAVTIIVDANHRYLMSQTSPNAPQDLTLDQRRLAEATEPMAIGGGRMGRGSVSLSDARAPLTAEDSAKLQNMLAERMATLKMKLDAESAARGTSTDTAVAYMRGRGGDAADKAKLDSAVVLLKLAQAKLQASNTQVQATVKQMLEMLRQTTSVQVRGIKQLQNHFVGGVIGPRPITIVVVELMPPE